MRNAEHAVSFAGEHATDVSLGRVHDAYNLPVLDDFSSDAIPLHLTTHAALRRDRTWQKLDAR